VTIVGEGSYSDPLTLGDTAVTPGVYTNLNATIDQQGRITLAANGTSGVLTPNGVVAGTYDGATVTVDANGLTTFAGGAYVSVTTYGATGDGSTDDRPFIILALAAAKAGGLWLHFPKPSVYYSISKYVDFEGVRGMLVTGNNAVIRYASDDTRVLVDAIATSVSMARSAFVIRNSQDVTVEGITFVGGDNPSIVVNAGSAIYERNSTGTRMINCRIRGGFSLHQQDNQDDTSGTGDSLTVAAGVATLVDAAGLFSSGMVGRRITLAGCTNNVNNNGYPIKSWTSATTVTFDCAAGITETSSFRWTIGDGDVNAIIRDCRSDAVRGYVSISAGSKVLNTHFEWPTNADVCGIGCTFVLSGTTVTMTSPAPRFIPTHQNKYVKITGSTTANNDGTFAVTYVSTTSISWTNALGVTEPQPAAGKWFLLNGEKAGVGAGATALAQAGAIQTVTASAAMFAAGDVGKNIRINGATTAAKNTQSVILSFVSSTQVTCNNSAGVSETFAGVITIESFDNGTNTSTYGSTHAIYVFGSSSAAHGRQDILVDGCTFKGNRTTCVKASSTAAPIRNLRVTNCFAVECGNFVIAGADDVCEHTDISVYNNDLVDCCTQRAGWDNGSIITFLGSRSGSVINNRFHFTRNSIGSVNGVGVGGPVGISASRFVAGVSQAIEDFTARGNKLTADPGQVSGASIFGGYAINVNSVGLRAKYRTGGTLTKSGNTMTLSDGSGLFAGEDVGKSVKFVFSTDAANDVTATITSVTATTFSFTNAAGVIGALGGTYRISPKVEGGACVISDNEIYNVGASGIATANNVGLELVGNKFQNLAGNMHLNGGDLCPRVVGNREIGAQTTGARIRLTAGTSWPYVDNNLTSNGGVGTSKTRDMGISVSGSAVIDHPLLGKYVRCRPSDGKEEVVIFYGGKPVDGDTINVTGTTYTYKAAIVDAATQFNSFASLVALIDALAGYDCEDYGTTWTSGAVAVEALRIRRKAATASTDGTLTVICTTLNPTFLVAPRNGTTPSHTDGRGSGSAGPTADKTFVWSNASTMSGAVMLVADNAAAMTLLQASGYRHSKAAADAGSGDLLVHGTSAGTEEFRAVVG